LKLILAIEIEIDLLLGGSCCAHQNKWFCPHFVEFRMKTLKKKKAMQLFLT